MTITTVLYKSIWGRYFHVADLTRGGLDDFAHNDWRPPADTYLEPDTEYVFGLDCVAGCANDNSVQFGTTYSKAEDSEAGRSIHDYLGFRRAIGTE